MIFDHIGVPTTESKEGENWITATKVWVTIATDHPYRVEWLRFSPDSQVKETLKTTAHVGFRVEDLDAEIEEKNVILGPFESDLGDRVAFIETEDGAIIEFMQAKSEA